MAETKPNTAPTVSFTVAARFPKSREVYTQRDGSNQTKLAEITTLIHVGEMLLGTFDSLCYGKTDQNRATLSLKISTGGNRAPFALGEVPRAAWEAQVRSALKGWSMLEVSRKEVAAALKVDPNVPLAI